jgi:hypothetical protein
VPRVPAIPSVPPRLTAGEHRLFSAFKERLELLFGETGGEGSVLTRLDSMLSRLEVLEGAGSITYQQLTPDAMVAVQRKNAIINGDFNVWQRGTSFAAVANGTYTADRWVYSKAGAMVHTASRSTDVPSVIQAERLFNYSLLVDCTTVDSAIAASDLCTVSQRVEGFNWLPLAQRAVTLSFWVKATKVGTYCVSLRNSAADRAYVSEYTVSTADTWEYKHTTFPASPSAGTWDYTNGIGVQVTWTLAAGSDFQGAVGSWNSANDFATSNQINACDNTANNFRLTGVQLEAGPEATGFEYTYFPAALALCERYFEKSYDYATAPGTDTTAGAQSIWHISASSAEKLKDHYKTRKRATPTVVLYSKTGAPGNVQNASDVADVAASAGLIGETGHGATFLAADQKVYRWHWTSSAEL